MKRSVVYYPQIVFLRKDSHFLHKEDVMIEFERIKPALRDQIAPALLKSRKNCEYAFTNLCIWGRQHAAFLDGYWVFFSQFDRKAVYPFPVGEGEILPVLDAIIADARQRGIPCCITGLNEANMATLEHYYPGKFRMQCDRGSFDYVYNIDDLADLKGRKFQKKRNHINRFHSLYPNWRTEPLTLTNLPQVEEMVQEWYRVRQEKDPQSNFQLEQTALRRAFKYFGELNLDGMVLYDGDRVLAFTMASPLSDITMDIHFEKAVEDADGAYTAINQAFAQYLRDKYPHIRYLDREEDMDIEGLRQAKLSYCPDHLAEKCWARLWEDADED